MHATVAAAAKYICDVCSKGFTQKGHFDAHKNRKRPCKAVPIDTLIEKKVQEILANSNIIITPIATPTTAPTTSPTKINSPPKPAITKPLLKWVGGKTQILDEVLSLFPMEFSNYHEPFLGGGSVLLGLLSYVKSGQIKMSGKIHASDLNANLISFYKNIQSHPSEFIAEIKKIAEEFNGINGTDVNRSPTSIQEALTSQESYYYWIRSRFNTLPTPDKQSPSATAMLLFLNKTCFRGVYREGPRGFNVPFGNYKNPSVYDEDHIREVSALIKDVIFTHCPFNEALSNTTPGDFVYLDPPYAPEKDTSFVSYTADGFGLDNHRALFKICGEMANKKVKMLLSNAEVTLVKDLFPSPAYTTKIISCRRAIHSKEPAARANEVLITN
jgi:DNA adenine methylase